MAPIQNNGANLIFTQVQNHFSSLYFYPKTFLRNFPTFYTVFLHPAFSSFSVPYIPSDHLSALQETPPEDWRTGLWTPLFSGVIYLIASQLFRCHSWRKPFNRNWPNSCAVVQLQKRGAQSDINITERYVFVCMMQVVNAELDREKQHFQPKYNHFQPKYKYNAQ